MNGYMNAMRRYFEFSGRSSRAEFWFFVLFLIIFLIVATLIDRTLGSNGPGILYFLVSVGHLVPGITVTVRRLHDIDRTGLWVLVFWLAPLLISLAGMMMMGGSVAMLLSGNDAAAIAGVATMGAGFMFILLLDLILMIVALVFYVTRGTAGPNTYGPPPTV